jgi:hypothetical protein
VAPRRNRGRRAALLNTPQRVSEIGEQAFSSASTSAFPLPISLAPQTSAGVLGLARRRSKGNEWSFL